MILGKMVNFQNHLITDKKFYNIGPCRGEKKVLCHWSLMVESVLATIRGLDLKVVEQPLHPFLQHPTKNILKT
jgi:hypothetical protein